MQHSLRAFARALVPLLGVTTLLFAGRAYGQDLSSSQKQKLGLRLQPVVEAATAAKSGRAADPGPIAAEPFRGGSAAKTGGAPTYAVFVHTSDPDAVARTGASVDSRFDGFVTARATADQLRAITQLESVQQVRASGEAQLHNDEAAAFVGARAVNEGMVKGTEYTGEGVLACVIDSGIDYDHPDFIDDSGNSRIVSIWDQTFDTDGQAPGDRHPALFDGGNSFDYGTEYHASEIESGGLSTEDKDGHGTHVAGTVGASGNADPAGKHKGMAPGVNYLIVKAGNGGFSTTNIVNGLRFCDRVADQKGVPMVANMSLGGHSGPHDGTSSQALAVDEIVGDGSASGRAVVVSAGNEGGRQIHTSTSISASTSETVGIEISSYTAQSGSGNDNFAAQIWFSRDLNATATVTTPNGETVTVAPGETKNNIVTANDGAVSMYNYRDTRNGDRAIRLIATDPTDSNVPTPGTWTIELKNNSSSTLSVNGWVSDFRIGAGPKIVQYVGGDTESTVSIPGTATHAITVGSFMHRWRWTDTDGDVNRRPASENRSGLISEFSSEGPRRDGPSNAYKPEITAPGQNVISARSQDAPISPNFAVAGDMHTIKQGTSMSAPVVAGSVALLLEKDPTLTASEIKDLLTETADQDGFTGSTPNPEWGYGRLDVLEAMTKLVNSSGSATHLVEAYDQHPNSSYEQAVKLGGSGDEAQAIRFSMTQDGRLSGAYFHLYYPTAKNLSGPLQAAIYDDNGGVPGTQISPAVEIPANRLRPGTWNYQNLLGTNLKLSAGQTYYLVYAPKNSSDELLLMGENSDGSGNTLGLSSGTWAESSGGDLLVRPVVSSLSGVKSFTESITPSSLATATPDASTVELDWSVAKNSSASEYRIYRDTSPINGDPSSLTPIATTSASATSYTDDGVSPGKTYYYRLTGVDNTGTESGFSEEENAFLYPKTVSVQASRSFGDASSSSDYRLVALPGAADESLSSAVSGTAGTGWQAYREGSSELTRFDGSSAFSFTPGTGFWLTATEKWTYQKDLSTVSLQEGSAATIPVEEGWNIISNPLDKDVSWPAVEAATPGSLQPLWGFGGSFSQKSAFRSAEDGVAYYFYNGNSDRTSLTIPYPTAPVKEPLATKQAARSIVARSQDGAEKTASSSSRLVTIQAQGAQASVSSAVRVGVSSKTTSSEPPPVVAPPGRFEPLSLRVRPPEGETVPGRTASLMQDRRSLKSGGVTIPLRLQSQLEGPVQISAENLGAVDTERAALLRPATGETYDLRRTEPVTVTPQSDTETLKVVFGSDEYVESQKTSTLPDEVALKAYPNPVSGQATLEYALPDAASVELALYDVLGRRVKTVVAGRKEAGRHRASLDAGGLSSGVYFGRLRAGGETKTKKVVVVR